MRKVDVKAALLYNRQASADVWEMGLQVPEIAEAASPGQFVHIAVPGGATLLRRPISIADAEKDALRLFYRVVGKGTQLLSELKEGQNVDCLGPLGHGFDLDCKKPLLVGGGMGIAPLYFLAKRFEGRADILMGARNAAEMFWPKIFQNVVHETLITTDDGSLGEKGFTVDLLPKALRQTDYDRIFVCGPQIMMAGVAGIAKQAGIACQVSMEKHMACGVGACLSCTCESKDGGRRKKVCTDGPVFWAEEVL